MPTSVVIAIAASAAGWAAATAAGFAAGTFAFAMTTAVVAAAVSLVLSRILIDAPNFNNDALGRLQNVRNPVAPWMWIYGQVRVGGAITFMEVTFRNQYLHMIITLAGHPVEEIGDIWVDDVVVTIDPVTGFATAPLRYRNQIRVQKSLGNEAAGVQPFPTLVTESGDAGSPNDPLWTNAHCQTGRAKIYVRLDWANDLWVNGIPTITAVVKGKKVYDPRTGLTAYNPNAALCQADYLCCEIGPGCVYAEEINEAYLIAAANTCDELVQKAGGSPIEYERRYTLNGAFASDRTPREVMGQMNTAHGGFARFIGGKWEIHPGVYATPEATALTLDDLRGRIRILPRLSRRDTCNGVKGLYLSPESNWQPTDYPPVSNTAYVAEDNGERIWRELNLPFTTSASTAQRLAKIELERTRQQMSVEWAGKLTCYRLKPGDIVPVTISRYGWSSKMFEVMSSQIVFEDGGDGGMVIGVDLTLREIAASVYSWSHTEETQVEEAPTANLPDPFSDLEFEDLVASSGTAQLWINGDGTVVPRIRLGFTAPGNAFITHYEVEFAAASGSPQDWRPAPRVNAPATEAFVHPVEDGVAYDCRIRAVTVQGNPGEWAYVYAHTVVGKTAPPSDVTGATAVQQGASVIFDCDTVLDSDLDAIEIRIAPQGTTDWDVATALTRILRGSTATTAAVRPGSWTFMFRALDTSGNYSANVTSFDLETTSDGYASIYSHEEAPDFVAGPAEVVAVEFAGLGAGAGAVVAYDADLHVGASQDFSVAFWFRPDDVTGPQSQNLVRWGSGTDSTIWRVFISTAGVLSVTCHNAASGTVGTAADLNEGDWNHCVVTFDRDGLASAYIDASLIGTLDISATNGIAFIAGSLRFGHNLLSGVADSCFDGGMRKVGLYNRVLTGPEIERLFADTEVNGGLMGRWNMDEGTGTTLADSSGNGNNSNPALIPTVFSWSDAGSDFATFCRHHTGVLVPESTKSASEHTIAELFEQFVPYPVRFCTWPTAEADKSINAAARIYANITVRAARDRTDGDVLPTFQLDHRTSTGSYDGYENWTVGTATFRYARGKIVLDTDVGKPVITGLELVIDATARSEVYTSQAIGAAGTAIVFEQEFHSIPSIQLTPVGTTALIPSAENPSTTGFTAHLYTTAGAGSAGTANITATGP